MNTELTEALAAYAHEAWSGWMRYMFNQSEDTEEADGSIIIPAKFVARWTHQMATPYAELTEAEKKSDRKEAKAILDIVAKYQSGGNHA